MGTALAAGTALGSVRAKNTFILATTVSYSSCSHQWDLDGGGRQSRAAGSGSGFFDLPRAAPQHV